MVVLCVNVIITSPLQMEVNPSINIYAPHGRIMNLWVSPEDFRNVMIIGDETWCQQISMMVGETWEVPITIQPTHSFLPV